VLLFTAEHSELRKVLFLESSSVWGFLFLYKISWEPLNGFTPNSHGRRVVPRSVKRQGHQGQKRHFRPFRRPACGLWLV